MHNGHQEGLRIRMPEFQPNRFKHTVIFLYREIITIWIRIPPPEAYIGSVFPNEIELTNLQLFISPVGVY